MKQLGLPWLIRVSGDLEFEFNNLKNYATSMEQLLQKQATNLENNPPDELQQIGSNDEIYQMYLDGIENEYQIKIDRFQNVFPQFMRSSFFLNLWSFFEMQMKSLAESFMIEKNIPIKFNELNGDILTKMINYFEKLGGLNLKTLPEWEIIKNLQTLRNFLVHRTEFIYDYQNWGKVNSFILRNPNLLSSKYVNKIEIKEPFCEYSVEVIKRFVLALIRQI